MTISHPDPESLAVPEAPPHDAPPATIGARLAMYKPNQWLTTQDLQWICGASDDTITRYIRNGEIPVPVTIGRTNIWTVRSLQAHLETRLQAAQRDAEHEQAQKDTKVQALYGGKPHGRRP